MVEHSPHSLEAMSIILIAILLISVCLRFWSRIVNPGISLWLDDWLVLVALLPTLAVLSICLWGVRHHLGKHADEVTPGQLTAILKGYIVAIMCFDVALASGKLSALAFYVRIFGWRNNPRRLWKIAVSLGIFLAVSHTVIDVPVSITMCKPVQKYWVQSISGSCASQVVNFATMTCYSIFTDIYILVLPMPQIIKLRMKKWKKLLVFLTFVVGYIAPVMSVGRLITAAGVGNAITNDFSYAFVPIAYWCIAEPSILILAVSLHALFQLTKRAWQFGPRALLNARDYSQLSSNRTFVHETSHESSYQINSPITSNKTPYASIQQMRALEQTPQNLQLEECDVEQNANMPSESICVREDIMVGYDLR